MYTRRCVEWEAFTQVLRARYKVMALTSLCVLAFLFFPVSVDAASIAGAKIEKAEFMVGGGMSACIESGDADCDEAGVSYALLLAPGSRINKYLGLYADLSYGAFSPKGESVDDAERTFLSVMPTARVFLPLRLTLIPVPVLAVEKPGDTRPKRTTDSIMLTLHWGLGAGYSSMTSTANDSTVTKSNYMNFKTSVGLAVAASHNVDVGVNSDYIFQNGGELCMDASCEDFGDNDVENVIQAVVFFRVGI